MTWYYVKDGEAAGPISDEELLSKLRLGNILPTTLVWRSGLSEWQPAATVAPQIVPPSTAAPSFSPALSPNINVPPELTSGTPPVLPHFFCTMCGNIIPADQLVRISGRAVCAACKPTYVQQTREGIRAPVKAPVLNAATVGVAVPDSDLADPAIRFVAHILDLLFIGLPLILGYAIMMALVFALLIPGRNTPPDPKFELAMMVGMLSFFAIAFAWVFFYWTWFIGRRGATPGMKIMKVKMVRADRTRMSYGHALGRAVLLYLINSFTMGLTNITAFFDRERRTVVDMICDTRVVRN